MRGSTVLSLPFQLVFPGQSTDDKARFGYFEVMEPSLLIAGVNNSNNFAIFVTLQKKLPPDEMQEN